MKDNNQLFTEKESLEMFNFLKENMDEHSNTYLSVGFHKNPNDDNNVFTKAKLKYAIGKPNGNMTTLNDKQVATILNSTSSASKHTNNTGNTQTYIDIFKISVLIPTDEYQQMPELKDLKMNLWYIISLTEDSAKPGTMKVGSASSFLNITNIHIRSGALYTMMTITCTKMNQTNITESRTGQKTGNSSSTWSSSMNPQKKIKS